MPDSVVMPEPTQLLGIEVTIEATAEARWRAEFERQRYRHSAIRLEAVGPVAPVVRRGLAASLPAFQLGESGMGLHLLPEAERDGTEDYLRAMEHMVWEEQEHARLLADVCKVLDIDLIETHWTDEIFKRTRRLSGLRAETLMLLVAEFISVPYYRTLAAGVGEPELARVFARIAADEERHLEFHVATLPRHLNRWAPSIQKVARSIWRTAMTGSAIVVALDHRKALRACNSGVLRFVREAMSVFNTYEPRFFTD